MKSVKNSTINLTLSEELMASLVKLAEFEKKSVSSLVEDFIQDALEHEVDMKLCEIAYERRNDRRIKHEDAWGDIE